MHVEVALIAVVIVSVLGFGIVICMYWRATRKHNKALAILYDQLMKVTRVPPTTLGRSLDQNVANLAYKKKYEVKREMLSIGNKIGEGQFGQVWVGVLKRSRGRRPSRKELMEKLPVAIKGPLDGKDPLHHKTLADELKILCAIGKHPNVLGLVGAITKNMLKGEFFVITEFCEYGNLKKFLEDRKSNFINELDGLNSFMQGCYANELDQQWSEDLEHSRLLPGSPSLTTSDLLSFGMQVAQGMEYLSSRPCIHRDLAARNVLITSNFVCRVADFGLAKHEDRDYYRAKTDVPMPVRWMSIEAIDQGLFTVESDVWSYGILLYELFTLGDRPYPTISDVESLSLGHRLKKGLRNSRPIYCHEEMLVLHPYNNSPRYQLMQQCWQEQTGKRPTFTQCANLMKRHLERSSPQLLRSVQNNISEEAASQEHYENLISQDMPYIMYTQGAGCIFSAKSCLVMWTVVAIIPSLFLFPMGLTELHDYYGSLRVNRAVMLIYSIIQFFICISVVCGAMKNSHRILKATLWMVIGSFVLYSIMSFRIPFSYHFSESDMSELIAICTPLFSIQGVLAYMIKRNLENSIAQEVTKQEHLENWISQDMHCKSFTQCAGFFTTRTSLIIWSSAAIIPAIITFTITISEVNRYGSTHFSIVAMLIYSVVQICIGIFVLCAAIKNSHRMLEAALWMAIGSIFLYGLMALAIPFSYGFYAKASEFIAICFPLLFIQATLTYRIKRAMDSKGQSRLPPYAPTFL